MRQKNAAGRCLQARLVARNDAILGEGLLDIRGGGAFKRAHVEPYVMMILWVALGGALGASLRWCGVLAVSRAFGPGFPWGTAMINVAGSFLMGIAAAYLLERSGGPRVAAFLMPGLLGGFTTFSAFSLDAFRLIEAGRVAAAMGYIGGSVLLSIAALSAGLVLGRAI